MTLMQEAYTLMQQQPEANIKIIVDLLRAMTPHTVSAQELPERRPPQRTGIAKNLISLPEDFDQHFKDMDDEIALDFYGSK